MNIVFLDCDGVLNHNGCDHKNILYPVDPVCVARAIRIAREGNAKFVISSSWRRATHWKEKLVERGIPAKLILDRTRITDPLGRSYRGDQITDWLDEHPGVQAYVVLDDDTWDMGVHAKRCVQTSMLTGLRDEHVELALTILRRGVV